MIAGLRRFTRAHWVALLALSIALADGAVAGVPGVLRLGERNNAPATTTLVNDGGGAALALTVAEGEAPLTVSSTGLVARLNAAKLGGLPKGAFAIRNRTYTRTVADARFYSVEAANGRFVRVLRSMAISGDTSGGSPAVILDTVVTAPAAGVVIPILAPNITGGDGNIEVEIDGVSSMGLPQAIDAGDFSVKLTLTANSGTPSLTGVLVVIFFPDPTPPLPRDN